MLLFMHLSLGWLLAAHAICFGLGIGGGDPLWITIVKRRMPADQFARAWGARYFLGIASAIAGPIGAGWLYDATGTFTVALATELALVAISMPLCLTLVRRAERDNRV
jgi:MFS family permease